MCIWKPVALGSASNDPDGSLLLRVYTLIKQNGLGKKILYGSDGPQFPGYVGTYLSNTKKALERAGYSVAEARDVFMNNFLDLFDLDECQVV